MKKRMLFIVFLGLSLFIGACENQTESDYSTVYLVAIKDGKYGVINREGDEILPFIYGKLSNVSPDGVLIHRISEDNYELIDLEGNSVISDFDQLYPKYDWNIDYRFTQMIPDMFFGLKNNQYCVYDSSGALFYCSDEFVYVNFYNQQLQISEQYYVSLNDVSKSLINSYDWIYQTSDTAYYAKKDEIVYVLDQQGEIKFTYEGFSVQRSKNIIVILNSERVYAFDFNGVLLFDNPQIEQITQHYGTEFLLIVENGLTGLYDLNGDKKIDPLYESINPITKDFIIAKIESNVDIYYKNEKINTLQNINWFSPMNSIGFDDIYVLEHNLTNDYYYYKDDTLLSSAYKKAYPFNQLGYAVVQLLSLEYAIIDMDFQIVHQIYDSYKPFGNYFIVETENNDQNRIYGIIDHLGEIIFPIEYNQIHNYIDYLISTQFEGDGFIFETLVFDQNQNLVPLFELTIDQIKSVNLRIFDYYADYFISGYVNHHYPVNNDNPYQIVDLLDENYLIAIYEGKYGVIDSNYNILVPFEYDQIYGCLFEN